MKNREFFTVGMMYSVEICRRCVMDSSAPNLQLDSGGLCHYCREFDHLSQSPEYHPSTRGLALERALETIKRSGKGHRYDCVMGLSGGCDSSYALELACSQGLRPLVVHVDNGWNTEVAVLNIEKLVKGLGVDLYTWVIEWEEFRQLQLSLFRAGVVDLELASDHAILAGMYRAALKFRVRNLITGDNFATESTLPPGWNHPKTDLTNLLAIHKRFSQTGLTSFPQMSTLRMLFWQRVRGMATWPLLSYFDYHKDAAKEQLLKRFDWRDCGAKHCESIITRFYQGHILPKKFGIDKRRLHFSRLICSGQLMRQQALELLAQPHYPLELQNEDTQYFIKKLGLSQVEYEQIMQAPPKSHYAYPSDQHLVRLLIRLKGEARRWLGK